MRLYIGARLPIGLQPASIYHPGEKGCGWRGSSLYSLGMLGMLGSCQALVIVHACVSVCRFDFFVHLALKGHSELTCH